MLATALTFSMSAAGGVVTNLHQFQELASAQQRVTCQVQLRGVVCWVSPGGDRIVLQDATGAAVVETDPQRPGAYCGDVVTLNGGCTGVGGGGVFKIEKALVVNNDRNHYWREKSGEVFLEQGKHPFRVAWFNQTNSGDLKVSYEGPGFTRRSIPDAALFQGDLRVGTAVPALFPGIRWRSYEGTWLQVPQFDCLHPCNEGGTSNLDLGVRSRETSVAICFDGWLEVPRSGDYKFVVGSAGGSQLFVGLPQLRVIASAPVPAPQPVKLGQILSLPLAGFWAEVEGQVDFLSRREAGGLSLVLKSGTGKLRVEVAEATDVSSQLAPGSLVRLRGVCWSNSTLDEQSIPGLFWVPDARHIKILSRASQPPSLEIEAESEPLPTLTTIRQIKQLKREEAMRGYPVKIRGVVTWSGKPTGVVLQDATAGIFVEGLELQDSYHLRQGEYWEVEGVTVAMFSPMVMARQAVRLDRGCMPEPVQPTRDQLMNGSLDTHYVELRGVATVVESNRVTLLTAAGKIRAELTETAPREIQRHEGALLRIRGCLWAAKDEVTHVFKPGEVEIHSAVISVEEPPPAHPFVAPLKRAAELLQFDAQAAMFKQVKVAGQVVQVWNGEYFLMDETGGMRFVPRAASQLSVGDKVEVVGFPELGGASPILREALVKRTGHAALPPARELVEEPWPVAELDATRVRTKALLLNLGKDQQGQVLGLQAGPHLFSARIPAHAAHVVSFPEGSKVELTGTFAGRVGDRSAGHVIDSFELLVNSSADVHLLARPVWATVRQMMIAVGILVGVLAGALVWITMLHRQVDQRTVQLGAEIQERERAERLRAIEEDRSRIARDIHDDLGASLTQVALLGNMAGAFAANSEELRAQTRQISEAAHEMVKSLEAIVWAVRPENDTLRSLLEFMNRRTDELFEQMPRQYQFVMPSMIPEFPVRAEVRHNVFLAYKEALTNVLKHAMATAVHIVIACEVDRCCIQIADDGAGFDPGSTRQAGCGLRNMRQRMQEIGGEFKLQTQPGDGATVQLIFPLRYYSQA